MKIFFSEKTLEVDTCCVCFEDFTKEEIEYRDIVFFNCGHLFHDLCLKNKWRGQCSHCMKYSKLHQIVYHGINRFSALNQRAGRLLDKIRKILNEMTPKDEVDRNFGAEWFMACDGKEEHTCSGIVKGITSLFSY